MRSDKRNWTSHGTDGYLVRQAAKGELRLEHADTAFLILMGDWCGKAGNNADT
jgi:hypothetical protein